MDYRDKQRGDDQGDSGSTHDPLTDKIADDEGSEPGDTDHYCGECSDGSESHLWILARGPNHEIIEAMWVGCAGLQSTTPYSTPGLPL